MLRFLHLLRPTTMSIAAAALAPFSSLSIRNPELPIYHNPVLVNRYFLAISPLSSSFSNASARCFSAAADKVRVQNPVVEIDEGSRDQHEQYCLYICVDVRIRTQLLVFTHKLQEACIETVESGKMTKDLALLIHGPKVSREFYLSTEEFIDAVAQNLESKLRPLVTVQQS